MNLDELCLPLNSSPQLLPKSVKVRSTCNACQQAKIRCGHEKPACRRCQKQRIQCVYSMSRRLGRPAKKLSQGGQGGSSREERRDGPDGEKKNKTEKSTKKKSVDHSRKSSDAPSTGAPSSSSSSSSYHHAHGQTAKDGTMTENALQISASLDPMNMNLGRSLSGKFLLLRPFGRHANDCILHSG